MLYNTIQSRHVFLLMTVNSAFCDSRRPKERGGGVALLVLVEMKISFG